MTTQGPFWLVYLTSPGTMGSVSLMLLVRSSEFTDLSESQQFSLSATFHFCESIGATPLSGRLLGHLLALTGPKYGAKRDPAWVGHRVCTHC